MTRSTGQATTPVGTTGTAIGVKRRQAKVKSKTPAKPKSPQIENNKAKIRQILWNLFEKNFPRLKIVLEPYKNSHHATVSVIIAVILILSAFLSFIAFINANRGFWQRLFTAELPSVYFNEVSILYRYAQPNRNHF